jgi:hypothetical protein
VGKSFGRYFEETVSDEYGSSNEFYNKKQKKKSIELRKNKMRKYQEDSFESDLNEKRMKYR